MLTAQILATIYGAPLARASIWAQPLQAACDAYAINTPLRIAAWLAQIGVESARLTAVAENLNYSTEGLLATFPSYFDEQTAQQYANKPPMIANRVYANRMGNGDEASGDGWRYRGGGLMMLSGHDNYVLCGMGINLPLLEHPELLQAPDNAAMSAAWFWGNANLNPLADVGNFLGVSRAVNCGSATSKAMPNGYSQRLALYSAAKKALGIA